MPRAGRGRAPARSPLLIVSILAPLITCAICERMEVAEMARITTETFVRGVEA